MQLYVSYFRLILKARLVRDKLHCTWRFSRTIFAPFFACSIPIFAILVSFEKNKKYMLDQEPDIIGISRSINRWLLSIVIQGIIQLARITKVFLHYRFYRRIACLYFVALFQKYMRFFLHILPVSRGLKSSWLLWKYLNLLNYLIAFSLMNVQNCKRNIFIAISMNSSTFSFNF